MYSQWGTVLWDQTNSLIKHGEHQLATLDRLQKYSSEVAKFSSEAAQNQKKLYDRYAVEAKKSGGGLETSFVTAANGFSLSFQQLADTWEVLADVLRRQATTDLKQNCEESKRRLKKWKADKEALDTEMKRQKRLVDEETKKYKDKYKEMLKSKEDFEHAEADKSLSRLDVEKASNVFRLKCSEFGESKKDYAAAVQNFNGFQRQYYGQQMPAWGSFGDQMVREQVSRSRDGLMTMADCGRECASRFQRWAEDVARFAQSIDLDKDSGAVVQSLSTGAQPPPDIAFIDLERTSPAESIQSLPESDLSLHGEPQMRRQSNAPTAVQQPAAGGGGLFKKSLFGKKSKQEVQNGNSGQADHSRRSQDIKEEISRVRKDLDTAVRRHKKSSGDHAVQLQAEIEDLQRRLQALCQYAANTEHSAIDNRLSGSGHPASNNSGVSQTLGYPSAVSSQPAPAAEVPSTTVTDACGSPTIYVGSCTAVHPYEAGSDPSQGYLSFQVNDQFYVLQGDSGTGWLMVERLGGTETGYIPTSYVDLLYYDQPVLR